MHPVLLYLTCKDKLQAEAIALALLEKRLIACANILPEATSLYRWEGTLERAQECIVIMKSLSTHVPTITETIETLHTYACPCIVTLPIEGGNPEFLKWVKSEVEW